MGIKGITTMSRERYVVLDHRRLELFVQQLIYAYNEDNVKPNLALLDLYVLFDKCDYNTSHKLETNHATPWTVRFAVLIHCGLVT